MFRMTHELVFTSDIINFQGAREQILRNIDKVSGYFESFHFTSVSTGRIAIAITLKNPSNQYMAIHNQKTVYTAVKNAILEIMDQQSEY